MVLLLGAGFSYDAGLPLAAALTKKFCDLFADGSLFAFYRKTIDRRAVDALEEVIAEGKMNYEEILGWLYLSQYRFEHRDLLEAFSELRTRLTDMVYHILLQEQNRSHVARDSWIANYKGIADLAALHKPLRIFSLNHDLVIEEICEHFAVPLESGFGGDRKKEILAKDSVPVPFSTFTLAEMKSGKLNLHQEGTHGLNLYKVHGGLDFFIMKDQTEFVRVNTGSVKSDLTCLNLLGSPEKKGVNVFGNSVVTDETGEIQFLRRLHVAGVYKFDNAKPQNLPEEWLSRFRADINYAFDLVCIGYSFGDLHINAGIRNWIEHNTKRKLWIVDPSISTIPQGFRQYHKQVFPLPIKTAEFLNSPASYVVGQ